MAADIPNNEKSNLIVIYLFIRGRKLNISVAFITQFYSSVPKIISLSQIWIN